MRPIQSTYKALVSALILIPALLAGGCVNDDGFCTPDPRPQEKGTFMEFTIVTRHPENKQPQSRALVEPTTPLQVGFPNENYLDIANLRFLLFDSGKNLIQSFRPEVKAEEGTDFVKYSVKAFINHPYFTELTADQVTFHIMVVGNYTLLTPIQNFEYHVGENLDNLFDPDNVGTFATPKRVNWSYFWRPTYLPTPGNPDRYTDALGITHELIDKAYIPMAGLQTFTVTREALMASTVENPLQLSPDASKEINMLRTLAKIEVVDRINAVGTGAATVQPDKGNRSYIEKAELMGFTTRGSILPGLNQWRLGNFYETQYCTAPSVPSSATFYDVPVVQKQDGNGNPIAGTESELNVSQDADIINFFADAEATAARDDKCTVFSCYVTEYDAQKIASGQTPMWIRATVLNPGDEDKGDASLFYRINVAPYTNGVAGNPVSLIRNNIYRYEVTSISQEINLKWTVCNMDTGETSITFN